MPVSPADWLWACSIWSLRPSLRRGPARDDARCTRSLRPRSPSRSPPVLGTDRRTRSSWRGRYRRPVLHRRHHQQTAHITSPSSPINDADRPVQSSRSASGSPRHRSARRFVVTEIGRLSLLPSHADLATNHHAPGASRYQAHRDPTIPPTRSRPIIVRNACDSSSLSIDDYVTSAKFRHALGVQRFSRTPARSASITAGASWSWRSRASPRPNRRRSRHRRTHLQLQPIDRRTGATCDGQSVSYTGARRRRRPPPTAAEVTRSRRTSCSPPCPHCIAQRAAYG